MAKSVQLMKNVGFYVNAKHKFSRLNSKIGSMLLVLDFFTLCFKMLSIAMVSSSINYEYLWFTSWSELCSEEGCTSRLKVKTAQKGVLFTTVKTLVTWECQEWLCSSGCSCVFLGKLISVHCKIEVTLLSQEMVGRLDGDSTENITLIWFLGKLMFKRGVNEMITVLNLCLTSKISNSSSIGLASIFKK